MNGLVSVTSQRRAVAELSSLKDAAINPHPAAALPPQCQPLSARGARTGVAGAAAAAAAVGREG